MNLVRDTWNKKDFEEFNIYLKSLAREEKIGWTKKILNTKYEVYAILSNDIKRIVKEIKKGNYEEFIRLNTYNTHENIMINGYLISYIKDIKKMKQYLDIYESKIDSWAHTDILKFNIKSKEEEYFNLVEEYINSNEPFKRRTALIILFSFINNDIYIDKIFKTISKLELEENYYVNMAAAWLLCELFIKRQKESIEFLNNNHLNKFIINKMISKCRDSYRIDKKSKEEILKYKKTNK